MPRPPSKNYGESPKERAGLPPRPFLYTLDQIAVILNVTENQLKANWIYFEGRSTGIYDKTQMRARNIANPDAPPDWRVLERDLITWMRWKGFRYYERGIVF